MQNKKLLFLKSAMLLVLALVIHTPECSAKGSPAGKTMKKVGKAVGGSMKKAKKMLGDVKKMFKCVVPIGKAFASAAKNPKKGKKALQSINKCMKSVKDLSKTCDNPAMLGLTAVPEVGPQLSHGCGIASKYEGKYDSIMAKIEQAESFASNPTAGLESAADSHLATGDDDTSDGSAGQSSTNKRKRS